MAHGPLSHHRRSIRLRHYDYSQRGVYYVTVVTQDRACLFGQVIDALVQLSGAGLMVQSEWESLPCRFPDVELDEFVVMPNHFHGILVLADRDAATPAKLGGVVGAWKSIVTDAYIRGVRESGWEPFRRRLWQRNYWEHIVRDESDLHRIREYIRNNPANWELDRNRPGAR